MRSFAEIPGEIVRRVAAGARTLAFRTLGEGLDVLTRVLRADPELRYGYLYWPEVDRVGHHHGPSSPEFRAAARAALDAVQDHADALGQLGATVLLTADHGQVDATPTASTTSTSCGPSSPAISPSARPAQPATCSCTSRPTGSTR